MITITISIHWDNGTCTTESHDFDYVPPLPEPNEALAIFDDDENPAMEIYRVVKRTFSYEHGGTHIFLTVVEDASLSPSI